MRKSKLDITNASRTLYQILLNSKQTVSQNSLFRDDLFNETCESVLDRNEAMIVQDIYSLICSFAQVLRIYNVKHLKDLIESVNEDWTGSIAMKNSLSKSNYSVEFRRSVFIDEQLKKLDSLIDNVFDNFFFIAIYRMYFSFLICEVKCNAVALDIVDRQNAHSMTVVVRSVVKLYKAVKREKELHQKILVFSVLHDHKSMRIYDYYAIIEKDNTIFYRHSIKKFSFTSEEEKNKWTTYKFIKNVYNIWMSSHLKKICLIIDKLSPDENFDLSQSASFSQSSSQSFQQSDIKFTFTKKNDSQSSAASLQKVTLIIFFTQTIERASKKSRNLQAAKQQRWNVER